MAEALTPHAALSVIRTVDGEDAEIYMPSQRCAYIDLDTDGNFIVYWVWGTDTDLCTARLVIPRENVNVWRQLLQELED